MNRLHLIHPVPPQLHHTPPYPTLPTPLYTTHLHSMPPSPKTLNPTHPTSPQHHPQNTTVILIH